MTIGSLWGWCDGPGSGSTAGSGSGSWSVEKKRRKGERLRAGFKRGLREWSKGIDCSEADRNRLIPVLERGRESMRS